MSSQPVVEIAMVHGDAEMLLDELGDLGSRPAGGREAEVGRLTVHPVEHLLDLVFVEFVRSAASGFPLETFATLFLPGTPPPLNGAGGDAQEVGNVFLTLSLFQPQHG